MGGVPDGVPQVWKKYRKPPKSAVKTPKKWKSPHLTTGPWGAVVKNCHVFFACQAPWNKGLKTALILFQLSPWCWLFDGSSKEFFACTKIFLIFPQNLHQKFFVLAPQIFEKLKNSWKTCFSCLSLGFGFFPFLSFFSHFFGSYPIKTSVARTSRGSTPPPPVGCQPKLPARFESDAQQSSVHQLQLEMGTPPMQMQMLSSLKVKPHSNPTDCQFEHREQFKIIASCSLGK